MIIIISFSLGILLGLLFKGININITHKQDVDKSSDVPYNSSYGDPKVKQYLDHQFNVGDE